MTRHLQCLCATTLCIWLLVSLQSVVALEKWSRQLEATEPGISDSFDWIPLAQPADSGSSSISSTAASSKDRSANGRVLTYSQSFPPNGRFSDFSKGLNAPVSQKPSPFDFPYQFQHFGNVPQAQSLRQPNAGIKSNNFQSQDPTSQSFFKFEMPFNQQNSRLNAGQLGGGSGVNTGYQISHAFGGGAQATLFNSPLFNQQPVFPPEFQPIPQKPQTQQLQQKPLNQQNFIEDSLSLKNFFKENKPTQASLLQAVTPQVFPVDSESNSPFSLRSPFNTLPSAPAPSAASQQQQDLQYLYVPYNDVYNQAPQAQSSVQQQQQPQLQNPFEQAPKYSHNLPTVNPYHINQFYTPDPVNYPQQQQPNYYTTSTTAKPQTTSLKPSNIFHNFVSPQYSTTAKPKPKAHQPPLAMFLLRSSSRPSEYDVVDALRSSNTIAVIDSPTKNTPEIFVGPSGMPIPNGYTKFDLPYLSQLQGSQNINDVSFFVAPLSYRSPQGFNKILLPEPHVGSIVINLSKSGISQPQHKQQLQQQQHQQPHQQQQQLPDLYYQPQQPQEIQSTTHRPRTSTQRVKSHHNSVPNRGNKFSYYYDQDPIQEVSSPQVQQKDRPKKKRPQSVKVEQSTYNHQLNNPYAQFNPIPNQITTDEYYKLQTKPSTTSTTSTSSTTSTTSTSSTTAAPQTYFTFNSQPQIEFPGSSGHLYHDINQVSPLPPQEVKPKLTTRPPQGVTTAEEEYRMKQYYRQQDAIRNRPQVVANSNSNSPYEQVQYTPVDLEYEISKTTTTNKPRITFFSPTAAPMHNEEDYSTLPPSQQHQIEQQQQHHSNNNLPSNHRPSYIQNEITDSPVEYEPNPYQLPSELPQLTPNLPGLVNNLKDMKDQQNKEEQFSVTEQTYVEPESSTKPTRRPINRIRKPVVTRVTSSVSYSESESASRRPINRVRRPFGSRNTHSTSSSLNNDYDETTTTTTRRPSSGRNPLIRNPNRIRYQPTPEERQTLRVKPKKKYNGSSKVIKESEDLDYQRDVLNQNYPVFKPNGSRKPSSSPTAIPSTYDFTTTDVPTSETQQVYTVTPSNSIDNNNNEQTFPAGLLEPMQIAQQYNEYKNNYGPGYFPNQEDFNPTETALRNEINPIYTTVASTTPPPTTATSTTTTTTTTEAPIVISTRRSPFIRRNNPRPRTTTTETPTTTTPAVDEKSSTRNRLPPRKVIKVRARTRRPLHPASSTPETEAGNEATEQPKQNYRRLNRYNQEEAESTDQPKQNYRKFNRYNQGESETTEQPKQNYRKLNRFNQDLYEANDTPRRRYKQKFQLEGQESQWSPPSKVEQTNNFKPIDPKDSKQNHHQFENEPEIVTADPIADNKENYEIKVSANYGPSVNGKKTQLKEPNLKPEKSFAELLEEVMGKSLEEKTIETTNSPELTTASDGTVFESQKTTIANRILRRGKWKKTRVSSSNANNSNANGESFETAESQNIGSQLYNSLHKNDKPSSSMDITKNWKTTTPMTTAAEINVVSTSLSSSTMPMRSMEEYDMSTAKALEVTTVATTLPMDMEDSIMATERTEKSTNNEESATRRMDEDMAMEDDLEIQPSLFSEVKKQLHELFSIEESDDKAVTAALSAVGKRRPDYTNIKRPKVESTTEVVAITEPMSADDKKAFHTEFMKHVVYATSSPAKQEETSEAEICYRGRCIKSDDLPYNHKLN